MTVKGLRLYLYLGLILTSIVAITGCNRLEDTSSTTPVPTGPDSIPPAIPQGFSVINDDDSLTFRWEPNNDDTAGYELFYSFSDDTITHNPTTKIDVGLVSEYNLHDLTNGTSYSFRLRAYDSSENFSPPSTEIIETPVDTHSPATPTNFRLEEDPSGTSPNITLSWTNPTNRDFQGVRIMRTSTSSFPSGPHDGLRVYNETGESFKDYSITPGTFYYYRIFSYDEIPNFSSSPITSAGRSGIVN